MSMIQTRRPKKKGKKLFPPKSSLHALNAQQKKNNKARKAKKVWIRESENKKSRLLCHF